jgi:hypothetical protein
VRTLILSNYLNGEFLPNIVCSKWGVNHPSLSDFQCAVLDMKLGEGSTSPTPSVGYQGYSFYNLSDDVIRLLQAGGVVLCLNYYTFINAAFSFVGSKVLEAIFEKRRATFSYEHKFQGRAETSYDWLDLGFLKRTRLDQMNIRPGQQFKVISTLDVFKNYFLYVKEYHKIIQGIRREPSARNGWVAWNFRNDPAYETLSSTEDEVDVLAVTKVTDDPIAVAIKYRRFPGTLVFLPTYHLPGVADSGREETIRFICSRLASLGEHYYEESRRESGIKIESPPWLLEYRTKPAKDADKELEDLEKAKAVLLAKRDRYDRMLTLINGYGEPFEKVLAELFGKEWLGFDIEETEPGHPIDLFVKNISTGQTLAMQATGVVGKFTQSDKHFGALMRYLPESEEKNTNSRVERVVLVVNTYRDTPLVKRADKDDVSVPVQNLLKRNGVCLIRSCDLYNLWNLWAESPEKLSAYDIFKKLFECEGIWKQK